MASSNVLVVAVDGLRASSLGAYGNTMYPTPALDRFAAESVLFDWCYAPTADLAGIYTALWSALDPPRGAGSSDHGGGEGVELTLPQIFSRNGYETTLITDDETIVSLRGEADFGERIEIDAGSSRKAEDFSETVFAQLMEAACEVIENRASELAGNPRLVWVHSRGLYGPWDAPLELQRQMRDEGDPEPVESLTPPDFVIGESDDPDAAFRFGCAYAAQTMVFDRCWDGLLEAVAPVVEPANWLVMLLGLRGFPLGEHRRVGGIDARLYGEQLHVPWLIQFPDGRGRLTRVGELVTHADVPRLLLDTVGVMSDTPHQSRGGLGAGKRTTVALAEPRDALVAISGGSRAIRTAGWCLRHDMPAAEPVARAEGPMTYSELFVRPDDRWEANDVAKLCPEVVDELTDVLNDVERRLAAGEAVPRRMLPKDDGGLKL